MAINLMGKVIKWDDTGPYLNVLKKVRSLNQLIEGSKELISQGYRYDEVISCDLSTESIVYYFEGTRGPPIILELPSKYKPFSKEFQEYQEKCRRLSETYFTQESF